MNIEQELTKVKNYQVIFNRLRFKQRQDQHRRLSAPVCKDLTLEWILDSEKFLTKKLISYLRKRKYIPGEASKNIIQTKTKPREIFSLAWPDKLIEAVLADAINRAVEPKYSEALYSFRQGRSNLMALNKLSLFIKEANSKSAEIFIFKTDIKKYGESIDLEILIQRIRSLLPQQNDYFWELLNQFLKAQYRDVASNQLRVDSGLPAGFSLTPVCENIYLAELDQLLASQADLYLRFGDDLLIATTNYEKLTDLKDVLQMFLLNSKLKMHPEKTIEFSLRSNLLDLPIRKSFDYLGYSINQAGELYLSNNKERELKRYFSNKFKICFHTIRSYQLPPEEQLKSLIQLIRVHYQRSFQHPYLAMILAHGNDQKRVQQFDRWIAEQILKTIYKKGGDRVFRYQSYQSLRQLELPSLLHLTRLNQRKPDVNK